MGGYCTGARPKSLSYHLSRAVYIQTPHDKSTLFYQVVRTAHIIAVLDPMPVFRAFRLFAYSRRRLLAGLTECIYVASVGRNGDGSNSRIALCLVVWLLPAIKPLTSLGGYWLPRRYRSEQPLRVRGKRPRCRLLHAHYL